MIPTRFLLKPIATAVLCMAWATGGLAQSTQTVPDHVARTFGNPPVIPTTPLSDPIKAALEVAFVDVFQQSTWGRDQDIALLEIAQSQDPRLAWVVSDMMRFITTDAMNQKLATAAATLLNVPIQKAGDWGQVTNLLIAWDIPAPPDYLTYKRTIFTSIVPGWDKIFVEGDVDWRHVSWGGVLIDDRPFDTTDDPCNCIPAADNPETTNAAGAAWLHDDDVVFGITLNGQARAYPRQIMEVREMVNDTLGGRDLGIPYCTLCGSAQAYFTDGLPAGVSRPVLRTSGLLIRSNKVMYDVRTHSVFDTFLGTAVTGPLADLDLKLDQAPVITTTWGDWKTTYPHTTVLAEELALGRNFDFRNGRDAAGPIFPVGDVDPRLGVHEDVIGVVTPSGTPVAFQRSKALLALWDGQTVSFEGVELRLDAGGIKVVDSAGQDMGSHQAFWFAWSQFHPTTALWAG